MATGERKRRDVYVTDEVWERFEDRSYEMYRLKRDGIWTAPRDDAVEVALSDFANLDHGELLKRRERFNPPAANTGPAEATTAPA